MYTFAFIVQKQNYRNICPHHHTLICFLCFNAHKFYNLLLQFHEFYSLQSSLVQFHGIFEDAKLPPRSKLFGGRGLDVLQSKLEPFQEFLVKLLLKPNLKKSDLLFTFLTSKVEFNEASSHKLFKNVPSIKLTKERGQFLQSFLTLYRGDFIYNCRQYL